MRSQKCSSIGSVLAVTALALLAMATPAPAQTETILYSFGSYRGDGNCPKGGPLVFDMMEISTARPPAAGLRTIGAREAQPSNLPPQAVVGPKILSAIST